MAAARTLALELADNAPLTIAGAKTIINALTTGQGTLDPRIADAAIDRAIGSRDYAEGRRAFAEKRRPKFTGE